MRKTKRRSTRRGPGGRPSRRKWWGTPSLCITARNSFRFTSRKTWSAINWVSSRRLGVSKGTALPVQKTKPLLQPVHLREAEAELAPVLVGVLPRRRKRAKDDQQSN